jgi:predicted  nucleic acid-binding Zn-ribbon protein
MNSDLQKLIDLQEVDARIGVLKAEIAALPKQVAEIEAKLANSRAKLDEAQAAMKADEAARRKHESDIKDQQEKISKYRDQSLKVKTNDEYRALNHEIQFAEAEIRKLEDKILEIMVATDARKEAMKRAEAALKADTAANEKEKDHARAQTGEDEKQLAELNATRKELRSGVAEETLTHYDRVLKLRGSVMGAVYEDESCSICRVRLRPQVFQEVMSSEQIVTCFYCNRILYYVAPPPKPEEPAAKSAKAGHTAKSAKEESVEPDEAAKQ